MSHKKSRKHVFGRGESGGVNLGLIITPMLDMSFQLLAFFVMTYHPPIHVGFIEGSLLPPSQVTTAKPKDKGKDVVPKDKEPPPAIDEDPEKAETRDVLLITVRTVKKGQDEGDRGNGDPNSVEIKRPEAASPMVLSGDTSLKKDRFVEGLRKDLDRELKRILNEPGNKQLKDKGKTQVKLEVDGDLKHRYWMSFYDTCKMSGFQSIYFVAPPPEVKAK
jgi:biopolymer transport protein ExbD